MAASASSWPTRGQMTGHRRMPCQVRRCCSATRCPCCFAKQRHTQLQALKTKLKVRLTSAHPRTRGDADVRTLLRGLGRLCRLGQRGGLLAQRAVAVGQQVIGRGFEHSGGAARRVRAEVEDVAARRCAAAAWEGGDVAGVSRAAVSQWRSSSSAVAQQQCVNKQHECHAALAHPAKAACSDSSRAMQRWPWQCLASPPPCGSPTQAHHAAAHSHSSISPGGEARPSGMDPTRRTLGMEM